MADAFISYRRKPSAGWAQVIKDKLKHRHGVEAYLDTSRTDSTQVMFPERLMKAIEDSACFICILGDTTLESEWVQKEIQRAYELKKFCIPVFQEAYTPTHDPSTAVSYLLNHDGVHLFDVRNVLIDQSVAQIAALIPRRRKSSLLLLVIALLVLIVGVGVLFAINGGGNQTPTNTPQATTAVAQVESPSATDSPTDSASPTPTETPTVTLSPTITETPDYVAAAQTVAAQGTRDYENARAAETVEAATLYPAQTATQTALYAQQTETQAAILTATATQWTKTPTPNATLTITALIADWATQTQAAHFTVTATLWTNTPTPTPTFTLTHTPTITNTPTPTPNATQTLEAFARTPMPDNAVWTPVEREVDGVTMVYVPAGCFMMGSDGSGGEQCFDEPFWFDKTEVTQAQFVAKGGVKANANYYFTGDDRPVEQITWREAEAYCREKRGGRLPTEAEWEFAARGPDGLVYPWGDEFVGANVIYNRSNSQGTADVGSIPAGASWVGALDMSGNVWEWTSSLYRNYPYDPADGREDLAAFGDRVMRGDSWRTTLTDGLHGAYRHYDTPTAYINVGFRCALSQIVAGS